MGRPHDEVSAVLDGRQITAKFTPRSYQAEFLTALSRTRRAIAVWHRRAGKDLTVWNYMILCALAQAGVYFYFFPTYAQGKKVIWDGIDGRGNRFLSYIPEPAILNQNENEMQVQLRTADGRESVLQIIGTDRMDSVVGTNPIGCAFSEYALQNPRSWDLTRPILRENGGWAAFIFTPRGRNHAYDLFERGKKEGWHAELRTILQTRRDAPGEDGGPIMTPADVEAEVRLGMDPDLAQQEFFCSFTGSLQGSYYGRLIERLRGEGKIGVIPWNPVRPVFTRWDIGVGDATAIWFFQDDGRTLDFIDYYENSGEGLQHYAKVLKERPYRYSEHIMPHDAAHRSFASGLPLNRIAEEMGIAPVTIAPKLRIEVGIDAVRRELPRCRFDEAKCAAGLSALVSYRKEWDDTRNCFKDSPLHDWASHGADAFRTGAVGYRPPEKYTQDRAEFAFDPLNYDRQRTAETGFDPMRF